MGYYRAGGDLQLLPSHVTAQERAAAAASNATPPSDDASGGRSYRRMNPTNVRALRRAMRRVVGFSKLARGVMSFTKSHKMKVHRRKR